MEAITLQDSKRLVHLESVIKQGRQTFVDVGVALAEIRDARLYRCDFNTFEDYCREKWGWERRHAYRLIEAAETPKAQKAAVTALAEKEAV